MVNALLIFFPQPPIIIVINHQFFMIIVCAPIKVLIKTAVYSLFVLSSSAYTITIVTAIQCKCLI
jgi:hypothetical protein